MSGVVPTGNKNEALTGRKSLGQSGDADLGLLAG
jgi:hypothetical protein